MRTALAPATPSRLRPWAVVGGWVVGALLLGAPQGVAEERVILDAVVERERLVLEIDRADIQVFVDPGGDAIVQGTVDSTVPGATAVAPLALEPLGLDAVVRRPVGVEEAAPRLRIDVLVPPEVRLKISGRDLVVRLESAVEPVRAGDDGIPEDEIPEDATDFGGAVEGGGPVGEGEADGADTRALERRLPRTIGGSDSATVASGPDAGSPADTVPVAVAETSDEATGAPGNPSAGTPGPGQAKNEEAPSFEVDLTASELVADGISHLLGNLRDSSLTATRTNFSLRLDLQESFAEIRDHQGILVLQVLGGETSLAETHGTHRLTVGAGASLSLDDARGRLAAELSAGGRLRTTGFRGDVELRGSEGAFEGRQVWSTGQGLNLRGSDLDVVLEDCRGGYQVHLDGGRLNGSGFVGRGRVTGLKGADIDLEDLSGNLALWLRAGSVGRVAEARGQTDANVESSELEIEDSQRIKLTAKDSTLGLRGISHLKDFRAQGTEIDLDLTTLRSNRLTLHLLSETRGEIRLAAPCLVQIKSADPLGATNADVSGCEVQRHGEGNRRRAPRRLDGSRMTRLTLDIAPDAEVEVEGY